MKQEEKKKNNIILTIILAVIFGLAGGGVGFFVAKTYIPGGAYDIPFFGEIDFSNGVYKGSNLIIREAKKVVVEQNEKASETISSAKENLVGIFKKKGVSVLAKEGVFDLFNYYVKGEEVGEAVIITSDGWIITKLEIDSPDNYVVAVSDGKIYAIDKVANDKLTSSNFLHIEARDLPVKKFSAPEEITAGQVVLAVKWNGEAVLLTVANDKKWAEGLVSSSDSLPSFIKLSDKLDKEYKGSALFNLSGDIVGILNNDDEAESINHFEPAIKSLLGEGRIKRVSLGLNYIDLSRLIISETADKNFFAGRTKGAIITKNASGVAVIKGSAAYLAGLKEYDIIFAVNNIELNEENNLSDALQKHQPNDNITISYLRNGEEEEAAVKLGEAK